MKISAIVVTKNEAQNIARCLNSLSTVADEIVVVDAYSQDGTTQICESFPNVHLISCPWIGLEGMKRMGKKMAQHEHTLSIAANEVLSSELQQNLHRIKRNLQGVAQNGRQNRAIYNQLEAALEQSNTYTYRESSPIKKRVMTQRQPALEEVW